MGNQTSAIKYRHIPESEGATLDIADATAPRVGTYFLMTCVGVYFRIDEERCFFAHMDARTPETWPCNVVTKEAGEVIVGQVKRRLRGFLLVDHWGYQE